MSTTNTGIFQLHNDMLEDESLDIEGYTTLVVTRYRAALEESGRRVIREVSRVWDADYTPGFATLLVEFEIDE